MKFLLDTHLLLWAASSPEKIPADVRGLLEDESNSVLFSAASLWEISIKNSLGREDFKANVSILRRGLLDNGWVELAISGLHTLALQHLPSIHKDPFDRILLAQAEVDGCTLLTRDKMLGQYPGAVRLV